MKVSLNWLKELVDVNVSIEELSTKFNLHSAEVEDFYNLVEASDLVIGHVVDIKKHPNADKLSVCQVDIGGVVSQIVCGAQNVDKGQKVIVSLPGSVLAGDLKIKKSTIRDVESNGMICSLSELGIDKKYHNEEGIHVLKDSAIVGGNAITELSLNDEVFSLELTPNRADLLSVMGVAYDTSAILGTKLHFNEYKVEEDSEVNNVSIELNTKNCLAYSARVIKDIVISESPQWIKSRLIASGIRPISNVVDITNYVMLETGQPLHAFDYDLFGSEKIEVKMAMDNQPFTTLDGKVRNLNSSDILITNGKKGVALGGVMGGFETEVTKATKTILLESAVFDANHIRKTSSRLDLRSEASLRFERKVDPKRSILALEMATFLFTKYASGKALKGISVVDNTDKSEVIIELSLDKINAYLGSRYTEDLVESTLDKLNFEYKVSKGNFTIKAPSRRQDILTYQDIIEEVARIIGYDKLPLTLPTTVSIGKLSDTQSFKRKIINVLTGLGLNEVITYSLVNENTIFDFVKEEIEVVKLSMPMSSDKSALQLSSIVGILDVVKYNNARKIKDVLAFEISKRYEKDKETELLSSALTGELSNTLWQGRKETIDFYAVKGILESLFKKLELSHLEFEAMSEYENLHPGQSAYILNHKEVIGYMGKVHPKYEANNDLKDVFVFELDLEKMFEAKRPLKKVRDINKFPSIYRDVALVVDNELTAKELTQALNKAGKRMLVNSFVFDMYQGESLGKNKKSLAIRLEFSDPKKTLEASEVDDRFNEILSYLKNEFNALLR